MCTHDLCFEQNFEKYHNFSSEIYDFTAVKNNSILHRRVILIYFACYISRGTNRIGSGHDAPNFEKVDGAYCFWSMRGCVGGCVTLFVPTVTFKPLKLES